MGLTKNERKTFLSINGNGKIAQKLKESKPGCVEYTMEDGKVIYQMEYDGLEGRITGMAFHDHPQYGKYLNVTIDNEFMLQLKCGSKYFYSFCYALPNVDLSKPVKLSPWRKEVDGKVKAALYINQGGDKSVEWFFSKDKPNGLPEMEKKKVKGKEVWDDSDRLEFMENYVKENIFPKLTATPAVPAGDEDVDGAETNDDDLPF